jgi:tRNA threonylcarbamoyladenosine biosynthesis protein TsaB
MNADLFLAIETSGRLGSVALARGDHLLAARQLSADRRHTAELLPTIAELLAEHRHRLADVDVFAYSCGPGSFTGLRVAATVGRMIQSAIDCRVVAVPTLEVITRSTLSHPDRPSRVVALLDAKRNEVYAAVFERTETEQSQRGSGVELRPVVAAGVYAPDALLANVESPFWIVGEGIARHRDAVEASGGRILDDSYWAPSAEHVLAIAGQTAVAGRFCRPEEIVPLYLRPPECEEVYEQRRTEARERRGE